MADRQHHRAFVPCALAALITLVAVAPALALHDNTVRIRIGDSRAHAADFYAGQKSISVEAAERWIRHQERERGVRVLDQLDMPEGTLMDFYRVRNDRIPEKRVEFEGRGRLVHAYSFLGRHYRDILFGLMRTDVRDEAIGLLRQARDHGFMILPAAMDGQGPVRTAAGGAQVITAIVLIPEFPHWNDTRPTSPADGARNGTFYETGGLWENMRRLPMAGNLDVEWVVPGIVGTRPGMEQDIGHWYADSPGGPLQQGFPIGKTANAGAWATADPDARSNAQHPRAGGVEMMGQMALQTRWYNLVFNKAFTNSMSNYFYQNSHGNIDFQGSPSHIIGWQSDHHQLDRIPDPWYPNPHPTLGTYYTVQPGTPLLRPTPRAPGDSGIVRASFYQEGGQNRITLFFKEQVSGLSLGNLEVRAYTSADTNEDLDGTQPGVVRIAHWGNSDLRMDPWDARRWTLREGSTAWRFRPLEDGVPEGGDLTDFEYVSGGSWEIKSSRPTNGLGGGARWEWSSTRPGSRDDGGTVPNPNHSGQGRGTGPIPDTLVTSADIVRSNDTNYIGSSEGNRLLSFCYYTHDHEWSPAASTYQLWTLYQPGGHPDPIAGTQDLPGGRAPRPAPFDHDVRDHGFPNQGGIFGNPTPGHTSHDMRAHVYQMLDDRGIQWRGYDRQIFVFPGQAQSEGDPNAAIQPHAIGPVAVVPAGTGLGLLAHEVGHTLGMVDLYDNNLYGNMAVPPPIPYHFESRGAGEYSVMAHGGRVDPWHKLQDLTYGPWATETPVTEDLGLTRIYQMETTLRDPVLLKLPAHPLSIHARRNPTAPPGFPGGQPRWNQLRDPDSWQEYFLLENRNVTGANYFGDPSPRGLYVWQIDMRNIGFGGRMGSGFQTNEQAMSVVPLQADGRRELQNRGARSPMGGFGAGDGDRAGDPFPGRWNIRNLREIPTRYFNSDLGAEINSATSWSHGAPEPPLNRNIIPGTPTDSFLRILNISDPGEPMSAHIFVEPAEVVVTGESLIPPPQDPAIPYYTVEQGTRDFPVLRVKLHNDGKYPNLSTQRVTINTLRIYEVGTSLRDDNIAAAKLYEVPDEATPLDPNIHTLLKIASVVDDYVDFTNLGYTVNLAEERYLVVAYDIANDAETSPAITIGGEITNRDEFFSLTPPGTVQNRVRTEDGTEATVGYVFGNHRFPITSATAMIVNRPDMLEVASRSLAPPEVAPGSSDVPIMQLELFVDESKGYDAVTITGLRVLQTGDADGGADVSLVRVFHDPTGGGLIEPDNLLGEAAVIGGPGAGVATISGLSFDVTYEALQYLILAVTISPEAATGRYVRLKLPDDTEDPAGCITLKSNPAEPSDKRDGTDYSTFPHEHGPDPGTAITAPNRPPYAAPAPNHETYGSQWYPRGSIAIPDRSPTCTFPRARNLDDADPYFDLPDPDEYDIAAVIQYQVQFSAVSNFASIAHTQTVTPPYEDADVPSFTVTASLPPAQYWWRVRSVDTHGAQSAWSTPAATFIVRERPNPPAAPFSPASTPPGSGNTVVNTVRPQYSWTLNTGGEAAGGLIVIVQVDDNDDFSSPQFEAHSQPGALNSADWDVRDDVFDGDEALRAGAHFFWRAKARRLADGMESDWTTQVLDFRVAENIQPGPPRSPTAPRNNNQVTTAQPTLSWTEATDPNPEDVPANFTYEVQLSTSGDWTDPDSRLPITNPAGGLLLPPITESPTVTMPLLGVERADHPDGVLTDNTQYFWRARVLDRGENGVPVGDGLWSNWGSTYSFWVNIVNHPPSAPESGFSPANSTTIATQRPRLRCNQAVDPDPSDWILNVPPATPVWPGNAMTYIFQLRPNNPNFASDGDYTFQYTSVGNQFATHVEVGVTDDLEDLTDWYWRVRAQDQHGALGPWSVVQEFGIDMGNQPPTLAPPAQVPTGLQPKYGGLTTNFELHVVYTDAENDPPDGVWVELYPLFAIDGEPAPGDGTRFPMQKLDPLDSDYTDGVRYIFGLRGDNAALGYGRHGFRFFTYTDQVTWPEPAPSLDDDVTDPGQGPIISGAAAISFTDENWQALVAPYEEGDDIYLELVSPHEVGTANAMVWTPGMADVENVELTETGAGTGVFRGTLPMLGRDGDMGDGVLNVISGPAGVTITAMYLDDRRDPELPPWDNATAQVEDTLPPWPIAGDLDVVNGAAGHGRTLRANWQTYDTATPPTQVDIVGYTIYYSSAGAFTVDDPDNLPAGVVTAGNVGAAVTGFTITGLTPNTDYWVAVVPRDEVPNTAPANAVGPVTSLDIRPPVLVPVTPTADATEVPLDSQIIFRIQDGGVGVDDGSVVVTVSIDGGPALDITALPEGWEMEAPSGTAQDRRFAFTPPAGFLYDNQAAAVRVQAADDQPDPNTIDETYGFQTRRDDDGPVITNRMPAPDASNVAPATQIRFDITDNLAGVDTDSLVVLVNGVDVTEDCTVDDADPLDVSVTYTPVPPNVVGWGQEVTVEVQVSDLVGNDVQEPNTWTYNTLDDIDPPAITNLSPAAGATNVRRDTAIGFRLTDARSGIDMSSLQVFVNETLVPADDLTTSGSINALNITYQPAEHFWYDDVVVVRVVASDRAANELAGEDPEVSPEDGYAWQFTIRPAPRYRITGTVRDPEGEPVPAVQIRALDADDDSEVVTTLTDGNGTYIVDIELGGSFRIVPARDQWDFDPEDRLVDVDGADVTGQDFVGTLRTYDITGRVTVGGEGLAGVNVGDGTRTTVTDEDGNYVLSGVPAGSRVITPALSGYTFRPSSRNVVVADAAVGDIDFEAVARTYSISGTVQDYDGGRVKGVLVVAGEGSAITNEAGQFTIGDVPTGTWEVSASKVGYHISPETIEVTVPPEATGVNFTAHLAFSNTFPVGINMIGVPCHPADPDPVSVFGTTLVARWNPNLSPPDYVMPGATLGREVLDVRPGRGYFVRLADGTVDVAGRPVSTGQPFTLTLGPVWNMVANMFTNSLPFSHLVPDPSGPIRNYGYVFDAARGEYLLISSSPGVNVARTVVHPWEAIWLRTSGASATASVQPPLAGAAVDVAPQSADLGNGGWTLTIAAHAGDRQDTTTTVGVGPGLSSDIQLHNPPMAPSTVDVYVLSADGQYLSQDVRAGAAAGGTWDFVVTTDLAGADVAVSLPDLSSVPRDLAVYLTDLETDRRLYARTMSAYGFTAGEAGAQRRFRLEVAPRAEGGLVITSAAASSGGGGVVVTYNVSQACKVTAQVTNIAGRTIRTLSQDREVAGGVNSVAWDLRSSSGTPVPNGRYLIRIVAAGEDGQQTQAITSAQVRR